MNATPNYAEMSKAALIEVIETQQQVIADLRWHDEIISNTDLPIAARFAARAIRKFTQTRTPCDDGYYKGYLPAMAELAGVSASTISRGVELLSDATDAIDKYTDEIRDEGGRLEKSLLYFRKNDTFEVATAITPTKELPKHGGNRRLPCPECGCVHRRRKVIEECAACSHKFYENEHIIRGDEEPLQDATPMMCEEQTDDPPPSLQLATLPPDTPGIATCNASYPSTPPFADCNASLSSSDIESQAAQILIDIAGTTPQHIKMCKDGDQKYISIHRAVHQGDMLAHLRGYQTIGTTLRHPFDLTRSLCFDADTPEEWQRLKAAARLLAIVGFKVILESSPAVDDHQGGGHLWIIFDKLVDTYSALQTVYQYAPALQEVKEYWPREGNHRVRLPGGKYVRPGVNAWCKLEDAYGNELSHDGAGAARVLLEYQTPAALVNTYTKPAPVLDLQNERNERKPAAAQAGYMETDLVRRVIDEFNASNSWDSIAAACGGYNRRGFFPAVWRDNQPPYDVKVDPKTDKAKDFGQKAWLDKPMDKYQVWCLIQGRESWEAFRKRDLTERCDVLRSQERKAS